MYICICICFCICICISTYYTKSNYTTTYRQNQYRNELIQPQNSPIPATVLAVFPRRFIFFCALCGLPLPGSTTTRAKHWASLGKQRRDGWGWCNDLKL